MLTTLAIGTLDTTITMEHGTATHTLPMVRERTSTFTNHGLEVAQVSGNLTTEFKMEPMTILMAATFFVTFGIALNMMKNYKHMALALITSPVQGMLISHWLTAAMVWLVHTMLAPTPLLGLSLVLFLLLPVLGLSPTLQIKDMKHLRMKVYIK